MRTRVVCVSAFFPMMIYCVSPDAWAQGSLTPPGAPGETMKTLMQVEPRTPIASLPYTVSQPGSYYLTTNLASSGHGVVITSDSVTLDLMGFTLMGDNSILSQGVFIDGGTAAPIRDVVVRNGIVRGFSDGVRAEYTQGSRFEHLVVSSNVFNGITLFGSSGVCEDNAIIHCTTDANGHYGVYLNGANGRCDGNTIVACTLGRNGYDGVYFYGVGGKCNGNTVANCTIMDNGFNGVHFAGTSSGRCNDNNITACTIADNQDNGVKLDGTTGQCNGNSLVGCTVSDNGTYGVNLFSTAEGQCDGNVIRGCVIRNTANRGISMTYADGNRVEDNHVFGQTGSVSYGIRCLVTERNLILRNTCVGQMNNFSISASDTYGPIVTDIGALPTSGAGAHPWANFSR